MKLNKKISKFLVLGLLTNNIYFNSSANTDIPNRYETLEGEYITINDSTEGNLEEIEIFGNTVQNENNLEDIQSVGDLYVDEDGNPILDRQGREQYKIDILSYNTNLFDKSLIQSEKIYINEGRECIKLNDLNNALKDFKFKPLSQYTISLRANSNGVGLGARLNIEYTDGTKSGFTTYQGGGYISSWFKGVGITTKGKSIKKVYVDEGGWGSNPHIDINSVQIELGITDAYYTPHQKNKTTILLPTQLQKVGDIADRLYWDNSKGRYIIEKNIGESNWDSNELKLDVETNSSRDVYRILTTFNSDLIKDNATSSYFKYALCNKLPSIDVVKDVNENLEYIIYNSWVDKVCLSIKKDTIGTSDIDKIREYLIDNNYIAFYIRNTAELIETNITSKLKIPTYEGKTHIYVDSKNAISPTLKVIVDRLPQIAKEAINQAENNSTSNNISLARMYVNMLPESLYKDQLQGQLNQIFSLDITLDRESATGNLDVYIKSQNMLSLSLDTNSVTFEGYSGTEPMEKLNAVNLTVDSSLPYDLNAYIHSEIANNDKSNIMDIDILNIKESSEATYQRFANTTDKIVLKSGCVKGNNINHSIDLKLDSSDAHKADVYKTVIKFEAEQK